MSTPSSPKNPALLDADGVNNPDVVARQREEFAREHGVADEQAAQREPQTEAPFDVVIRGEKILVAGGTLPREIGVRGGKIVAVEPLGTGLEGAETIELGADETLLPGLVDAHVHVNEPGRTEWEGYETATKAAAAGGVTTIIDMPLNSIPSTVNVEALDLKREYAKRKAFVDVGFWGGAVPGNKADLKPLWDEGVFGFKCFLAFSGVDEFPPLSPEELADHLEEIVDLEAVMIVHAEDGHALDAAPQDVGREYSTYLASRPRGAENLAIANVIEESRRLGARTHILHVSSSDALAMLRSAQRDGVPITAETCPHYLTLESEDIDDGATAFKCAPPIREGANQDILWAGLLDGTLHDIVSDHSPSTPELKDLEGGDFGRAWGGVSSVQLGLPLVWTEARRRGIGLEQVVEWMSARPAERAGLRDKGRIAVGADADFSVFAPDATFTVDVKDLYHRNPVSPYQGEELTGVVRRTFVRGDEVDFEQPRGKLLRRGED